MQQLFDDRYWYIIIYIFCRVTVQPFIATFVYAFWSQSFCSWQELVKLKTGLLVESSQDSFNTFSCALLFGCSLKVRL